MRPSRYAVLMISGEDPSRERSKASRSCLEKHNDFPEDPLDEPLAGIADFRAMPKVKVGREKKATEKDDYARVFVEEVYQIAHHFSPQTEWDGHRRTYPIPENIAQPVDNASGRDQASIISIHLQISLGDLPTVPGASSALGDLPNCRRWKQALRTWNTADMEIRSLWNLSIILAAEFGGCSLPASDFDHFNARGLILVRNVGASSHRQPIGLFF